MLTEIGISADKIAFRDISGRYLSGMLHNSALAKWLTVGWKAEKFEKGFFVSLTQRGKLILKLRILVLPYQTFFTTSPLTETDNYRDL